MEGKETSGVIPPREQAVSVLVCGVFLTPEYNMEKEESWQLDLNKVMILWWQVEY